MTIIENFLKIKQKCEYEENEEDIEEASTSEIENEEIVVLKEVLKQGKEANRGICDEMKRLELAREDAEFALAGSQVDYDELVEILKEGNDKIVSYAKKRKGQKWRARM